MKFQMIVPFLIAVLAFSCQKEDVIAKENIVADATLSTLPTTLNKTVMLQLINNVRQKGCQCGDTYYYPVPALTWNDKLELAAYKHSADMYTNKYFSHVAPDGTRGGERIEQAGYNWMAFGENIGTGYKTEKEVVAAWLASPGHCKNIMNKMYKEMGVARVGTLWTQEFGSK